MVTGDVGGALGVLAAGLAVAGVADAVVVALAIGGLGGAVFAVGALLEQAAAAQAVSASIRAVGSIRRIVPPWVTAPQFPWTLRRGDVGRGGFAELLCGR